jgi:hypothetical protein
VDPLQCKLRPLSVKLTRSIPIINSVVVLALEFVELIFPVMCRSVMFRQITTFSFTYLHTRIFLAMCRGNVPVNSDVEITVSGSRSESCDPRVR